MNEHHENQHRQSMKGWEEGAHPSLTDSRVEGWSFSNHQGRLQQDRRQDDHQRRHGGPVDAFG